MPYLTAPAYYRSIFLSDFHIGAKSFDAEALLDFLKTHESKKLYLVGDIIDGWKLNKRWHWCENCSRIFDELVRKAHEGTEIFFLPGNHDEEIRRLSPLHRHGLSQRFKVKIRDRVVHQMADGRRFLVLHGDQFDRKILRGPLSRLSDRIYDLVLDRFKAHGPTVEISGKPKRFSLAKSLRKRGQWALYLLNNFENNVVRTVRRKKLDGLISGHTHIPVIKKINEITYANCGAWLRSGHTALVEDENGALKLIDCPASTVPEPPLFPDMEHQEPPAIRIVHNSIQYRNKTNALIREIRRIWPEKGKKKKSRKIITLPELPLGYTNSVHNQAFGLQNYKTISE